MEKKARRKMARKRKQRKRRREWQPEDSGGQGKDMAGGGWRGWEEVVAWI